MKSICFLLTKKRASISSIAAADMKLIIVLHCSMLKLANAPSLRLYTHDMHVTLFMKKFTLRSNHKLIAWLHWVIIQLFTTCEASRNMSSPSSASPKSKSEKSLWSLSTWKIFTGLSFSRRLILTMPSLEKQPWMRPLHFNFLLL